MGAYLRNKKVLAVAAAIVLVIGGTLAIVLANRGGEPSVATAPPPSPTSQPATATVGRATVTATTLAAKEPIPTARPTATPQGGPVGNPAQQSMPIVQLKSPKQRPLAIMVENHPDARPQTGLDRADVVYEAPAEGGIPRFLTIFSTRDAKVLGPVRSARPYYVAWASEYDPVYIHAGGSPLALTWLRQLKMDSMDALRDDHGGFTRTTDRVAPHNLYADTAELRQVIQRDGDLRGGKGSWGGLVFSEHPTVGAEEGAQVKVTYNSMYNVSYLYDRSSGLYKREMNGEPHLDRATKKQLTASAVVIQSISIWNIKGDKYGRMGAQLQDKNRALIFQNGRMIKGFWEKKKRDSPTVYTTEKGQPVSLKPGHVWIQMTPLKGSKIEH